MSYDVICGSGGALSNLRELHKSHYLSLSVSLGTTVSKGKPVLETCFKDAVYQGLRV